MWADASNLIRSETHLGDECCKEDMKLAVGQISLHLPILVVTTGGDKPAIILANVHEMLLHPSTIGDLLSVAEPDVPAESRFNVRFARQVNHTKYKCVEIDTLQPHETPETQCFGAGICDCWRCCPRSFVNVPIDPNAAVPNAGLFFYVPGLAVVTVKARRCPEPVKFGGLLSSFCTACRSGSTSCSHRLCEYNDSKGVTDMFMNDDRNGDMFLLDGRRRPTPADGVIHRFRDKDGASVEFR